MNEDVNKIVEKRMKADSKALEIAEQLVLLRRSILEASKTEEWEFLLAKKELWQLFKDLSKAASICNKQAFSRWSWR